MDKAAAQAAHATGTQPPSGGRSASVKLAEGDSPDRPIELDAKAKAPAKATATATGMPTTRSRANLARSTAAGAGATRSSARLAPPTAAAAGRDVSSSDWSEDEDDEAGHARTRTRPSGRNTRTRGVGKQDLSGSYQLVDGEEMESSVDDDGVGRERLGGRAASEAAGAGGEKSWGAWITGR